ncbi:MAG: hypothetical protein JXA77_19520 [Bacteroidales bacterium]|nr:hypothetical protein [Bacteroidales bacterium]MBN2821533.1 hypothetical protein [Bacteroidales bacterium]
MAIKILKHTAINKKKWDSIVESSENASIYMLSWYLDAVSPGWEALIQDDYAAIFPLPVKKKFGIKYLVRPNYSQCYRIVGNSITPEIEKKFLNTIKSAYRYAILRVASSDYLKLESFFTGINTNFELDLSKTYEELFSNFSKNHKKNIKSSRNKGLLIKEYLNIDDFVDFTRTSMDYKHVSFDSKVWSDMKILLHTLKKNCDGKYFATYDSAEQMCALTAIVNFKKRWYLLFNAANEAGRKQRALYFALDSFIKQYAGSHQILDFEGSNIPSIAYFFEGFGAIKTEYYSFEVNRLPALIRRTKAV